MSYIITKNKRLTLKKKWVDMMNISKISRSLVVVVFVALIIFIGYQDVLLLLNSSNNSASLNVLKVVYVVVAMLLVALYVYIKDKLYRKKVKRNISLVYRYVYISFIVVVMSIISIYQYLYLITNITLGIYVLFKLFTGFVLKKIIFNVSKSDILSVLGLFAFAMLPCVYTSISILFINLINTLALFAAMLIIQKLIDELKQRGVKTKKYVLFSIILGILVGITIILGISSYLWISVALISLVLTANLDKTHIGFPKTIISSVNQKTKEMLYKVERVNISKLVISILLILVISTVIVIIGSVIVQNINIEGSAIYNVINLDTKISDIQTNSFLSNIINNTNIILSTSKTYYILILAYILFVEILAIVLHRRYDTKSTIMKAIFILLYISIAIFNLNIINYQTILTVFLILIAIVNTSNIYLNREERIKMLVA